MFSFRFLNELYPILVIHSYRRKAFLVAHKLLVVKPSQPSQITNIAGIFHYVDDLNITRNNIGLKPIMLAGRFAINIQFFKVFFIKNNYHNNGKNTNKFQIFANLRIFFRFFLCNVFKLFLFLQQNMNNHTNHKNQSLWKHKMENSFSV